jgi:hypothetical protein
MATGVLVVSSPRRLPKKQRGGGPNDLASVVDGSEPGVTWTLSQWERMMRDRAAAHRSGWDSQAGHPVLGADAVLVGDTAKRQIFTCTAANCGQTHTFVNINLLKLLLRAIARGESEVRLDFQQSTASPQLRLD